MAMASAANVTGAASTVGAAAAKAEMMPHASNMATRTASFALRGETSWSYRTRQSIVREKSMGLPGKSIPKMSRSTPPRMHMVSTPIEPMKLEAHIHSLRTWWLNGPERNPLSLRPDRARNSTPMSREKAAAKLHEL